jgi:acyl carrier protein
MAMTREKTIKLICTVYKDLVPPEDLPAALNEATRLFGGALDSVGLVSLIVELEQQIADRDEASITIADDRAMSQKRSPFRTIGSLADYVQGLMMEVAKA